VEPRKDLNQDQIDLLRHVKNHDRTKALIETQITWNKALMSSFARHLRTPSTRTSRVGSSKSISFERSTEKSSRLRLVFGMTIRVRLFLIIRALSISKIDINSKTILSFKSGSETKSMAVISEYDDGILTPVN